MILSTSQASGLRPLYFEKGQNPDSNEAEVLTSLRPFVRQSGDEWRRNWYTANRKLLDYMVVYILEGHGLFSFKDKSWEIGPGDLFWVPPNKLHEMRGYDEDMHLLYAHFDLSYEPARSHWDVNIPGGTISLETYKSKMHPVLKKPLLTGLGGRYSLPNHTKLQVLLQQIHFEHSRLMSCSHIKLSGLVLELLAEMLQGIATAPLAHENRVEAAQMAMEFIQKNRSRPLGAGEISKHCGLSASHLRKLFRQIYNMSPNRAHRLVRIQRAKELLIYSDLSVSEIAMRLGFSTIHNFSRAFSEITGHSPLIERKD